MIQCDLALSPVFTSQEEIFEPGYAIPMSMHMTVWTGLTWELAEQVRQQIFLRFPFIYTL